MTEVKPSQPSPASSSGGDSPDDGSSSSLLSSSSLPPSVKAGAAAAPSAQESLLRFLLLPHQVLTVLLLEFLNSFRSFGLRFVLYNYITNEFGISDVHAGQLLGLKGFVDILFGLLGSIFVDVVGVRRISLIAMAIAIVGRSLLAFGRSTTALYMALFLFSPCGDALLSTGLYRVALKKLTTPLTRPLAFAVSYAVFNLAGALADVTVDKMRSQLKDVQIIGSSNSNKYDDENTDNDQNSSYWSGVYTPIRQFIVLTWVIVLITFVIAYCFLEDWTVVDLDDLDHSSNNVMENEQYNNIVQDEHGHNDTTTRRVTTAASIIPLDAMPVLPMIQPHLLRRWFPNYYYPPIEEEEDDDNRRDSMNIITNYQMYRTRYNISIQENSSQHGNSSTSLSSLSSSLCSGLIHFTNQVITLLNLRNTWRVLIFGFLSFTIVLDWTASEMVLPPFLERRFGESIPIYSIQSINLFGCLILPPIVGVLTSGSEDFQIILPGLWLMSISPVFVALFPNVWGACAWQVFMTIGEVLWSPRQISWTASLALTGYEGLFFAISSARAILGPLTDMIMGAMNDKYNTNCPDCRDSYGHFCENVNSANQCVSVQEVCNIFIEENQSCPKTCLECHTWVPTDPSTFWYLLMIAGIAAPLSVWLFLPFLRGTRVRDDKCYGLFQVNKTRLLGIFGALDNDDQFDDDTNQKRNVRHHRQGRHVYGHLENRNNSGIIMAHEIDVELT